MFFKRIFSYIYGVLTCSSCRNVKMKRTQDAKPKNTQKVYGISEATRSSGLHKYRKPVESFASTLSYSSEEQSEDSASDCVLSFYSKNENQDKKNEFERTSSENRRENDEFHSINCKLPFWQKQNEKVNDRYEISSPEENEQSKNIKFNNNSDYSIIIENVQGKEAEILIRMKEFLEKEERNMKK